MASTAAAAALSMPRFKSIGLRPAATDFSPSTRMDCAKTVAVVVPSPAISDVLEATSLTSWAPIFSNLSESSISFATVTPSFVMRGAPNDLSITTLRPFGPSVTFTAFARISTPRSIRARASPSKRTSFADIGDLLCAYKRIQLDNQPVRRLSSTSTSQLRQCRGCRTRAARSGLRHRP